MNKLSFRFSCFFAGILLGGCALTPGQETSALVQAGGQAYGAAYLTRQEVNGVVPPAVLAQFEQNINGINGVMEGAMDPQTFQNIVQQVENSPAVAANQAAAIGFLDSVNSTFVRANSSPLTANGSAVEAVAQQLAAGLSASVQQITGQTFVPTLARPK